MRINKQDIEPHHGKHQEGGSTIRHERVGGGDRPSRLQAVWAELRRGAGGGSGNGDNER